ncbi:MAG: arginine deiminase family protein [Methanomicrobiales archaeon]|nr:arginine deiminase family protein [Methanomicrobiales archaeon]
MPAGAQAEWKPLRSVLVHEPGIEVFFALLSPRSHLYERFFERGEAVREHRELCETLMRGYGVRVHRLREVLESSAKDDPRLQSDLVALAERRLSRRCEGDACALPPRIRRELEDPVPLTEADTGHLLDIILLDPTLVLDPAGVYTEIRRPMCNLYFMRDQQAATDLGIVQGRMQSAVRQAEIELCGLALDVLGTDPVHRVIDGHFEGGDFIPAGDFALIGVGPRTDMAGAMELLAQALSFEEVAIVRQPCHPLVRGYDPMVSMHLDTYLNFASECVAVANPVLLRAAGVDIFHCRTGGYEKADMGTTLDRYLEEKGFEVVEITTLEQLCYATNFLCVKNGVCLAPDTHRIAPLVIERLRERVAREPGRYDRLLDQAAHDLAELRAEAEFFPHKKEIYSHGLEMVPLRLTNATGGYGGAHCMTCTIGRY